MFKRIFVPLDGSKVAEQVLPYVRFLSERLKVTVELVGIVDVAAIALSPHSNKVYVGRLAEENRRAAKAYLENVAKTFPGTAAKYSVETGKPEDVIIEKAGHHKGTLVAMATHGRSGMSRWLLGSVTEKVLRASICPLLIVRAGEGGKTENEVKFESIVVPLDTSSAAEGVLPEVIDLAKGLNLHVIITHAYSAPLSSYYGADDIYIADYRDLAAQLKDEARIYLEAKVEKLRGKGLGKVSSVMLDGEAAEEIIALARREPNSLVAMGTHGYSGVKRWVLGSVTEKVVRHCDDPVLVIRAG